MDVKLTDDEQGTSHKRLEALRAIQYPFGAAIHGTLEQSPTDSTGADPHPDPFASLPDKASMDGILSKWSAGEINDDAALTRLFPIAIHYHYGDVDEEPGENLLTPSEREQLPFAKLVTDAWFAVALQAPGFIQDHHLRNYESVGEERELGISADEFFRRYRKSKDSGQSPGT